MDFYWIWDYHNEQLRQLPIRGVITRSFPKTTDISTKKLVSLQSITDSDLGMPGFKVCVQAG